MERIRGCSKEGVEKRKVERGRKDMEIIWRWSKERNGEEKKGELKKCEWTIFSIKGCGISTPNL